MAPKKKKSNNYFTKETEEAILLYNRTESPHKRSKIYSQHIHYPFFKLTQNIIHTFDFYHTDVEDLEHLQHRIIVFLLDKIHLYNHGKSLDDRFYKIIVKEFKGQWEKENFLTYVNHSDTVTQSQINEYLQTLDLSSVDDEIRGECFEKLSKLTPPKAYSYFGTITKRWLIKYTQDNYKKKVNSSPIEDLHSNSSFSYEIDSSTQSKENFYLFIEDYVEFITENIYKYFPKKNDAKIADAVLELFRKIDKIEIFNKKALYSNIREILAQYHGLEVKTPKITKIVDALWELFEDNYVEYLETGINNFKEA